MPTTVQYIPNPLIGKQWERSLEARACVEVQGRKVEERAKLIVPVDTGFLRDSIEMQGRGGVGAVAEAIIGATAPYGGYVEYGTSDTPAQPYLRPALDTLGSE